MKIALVTDAWLPQVNGVVTTLVELVGGLRAAGHEVVLIEPGGFRRFRCPGYPEIELAWRPGAEVARRLDEARADAVHIATEGPLGWAARRHCLRRGWRFSTAFHTRFPEILARALHLPESWGYAWFRSFHRPASAVMVPTQGMLEILQARGFGQLRAWSHGVDLGLFQPAPRLPDPGPRPIFLYVGRLSWEKNLAAFLALDLPGTKLVYGTGPLADELRAAHPEVVWRGIVPRAELPAIYSSADVFVFPGRSETFGLVMLEALACGTPVLATAVGGIPEVLEGAPAAGELLAERSAAAIAEALRRWLPRDPDRAAIRQFALNFSWARSAAQLASLMRALAGGVSHA